MYKVLIVDDDKRYVDPLLDLAYDKGFDLTHYEDWEEAKSELYSNPDLYDAIIIDGRGKLNKDDKGDNPSHLAVVLGDLKELSGKGIYIPYVINTAYFDDFSKFFVNEEMNDKNSNDKDSLFKILEKLISSKETEKIKSKYRNTFTVFDQGIIERKYQHILFEMINCLEKNDYKKKNLNVIRDLLEAFFLTLIDNYECIPEEFKNNKDKPNHQWCMLFLAGVNTKDANNINHKIQFDIPDHISRSITYVKELTNSFSHINENEILKNSFISTAYAMFEILEWLPSFINENFE